MIENICNKLTLKIRKEMPEVDDERAEVINYGLQLVIGEIPKTFVLLIIAYICGVLELSIIALLAIMPYRLTSGGVHLKTHIGCIIGTSLFYVGSSLLSKYVVIEPLYIKYILIGITWVFSVIMIKLYAPADTENHPFFSRSEFAAPSAYPPYRQLLCDRSACAHGWQHYIRGGAPYGNSH